jgi:hypothetical protein
MPNAPRGGFRVRKIREIILHDLGVILILKKGFQDGAALRRLDSILEPRLLLIVRMVLLHQCHRGLKPLRQYLVRCRFVRGHRWRKVKGQG